MNLFPWTAFLPDDFENGIIQNVLDRRQRGAAIHFLAVFSKMKILWKLWLWFSKMFHQRVLSDWKWSISKFQFWRRIHDIYRQQLLTKRETIQANNFDRVEDFLCWTIWMGSIAHLPRKKTSRTIIKVRFTLHLAVRELIRELKQQRFWATDVNRKWTFCIIGQWFGWNSRVNRL